jgi:hypothetical protein
MAETVSHMSYSLKTNDYSHWHKYFLDLIPGLKPGDHVAVIAIDSEEGKTETIYIEIDAVQPVKKNRNDDVKWNYKGIVIDYLRTYSVPVIENGCILNFNNTQIRHVFMWRNTRSNAPTSWRVLSREETDQDLTNWNFCAISKSRLDHLVIGDIVRVMLGDPVNLGSKIYFEIFKIDYYTEGGVNRPKKFHGKALNIYMTEPFSEVRVGEVVEFQRKHIIEVPEWKVSEPFIPQPRREIIMKDIRDSYRIERKQNEEEYLRKEALDLQAAIDDIDNIDLTSGGRNKARW